MPTHRLVGIWLFFLLLCLGIITAESRLNTKNMNQPNKKVLCKDRVIRLINSDENPVSGVKIFNEIDGDDESAPTPDGTYELEEGGFITVLDGTIQ